MIGNDTCYLSLLVVTTLGLNGTHDMLQNIVISHDIRFSSTYDVLQKHIIAITSAQNMTSEIEADYTIRR
jgi:hypothetical protein